ncbi:MAG: MFS transporter [Francisellaceae bacterium]
MHRGSLFKFLKASIGNIIEWYDFSLFAYYSISISAVLFPQQDLSHSIAELFMIFGIGFIARPLGGAVLGKFGDRFGHYLAVNISVYGMSLCSFLIAFIPSYSTIGVFSIILLMILRLGQGFCAGGQFSGLMAIVVDVTDNRRSFVANIAYTVSTLGLLLAVVIAAMLHFLMPESSYDYLWRIAFIISGIFGVVFHFVGVDKTDIKALDKKNTVKTESFTLLELIKTQYRAVIGVIILACYSGCMYFFAFSYLYTYLTVNLHFGMQSAYAISMAQLVVGCLLYPIAGIIADRLGKQRVSIFGTVMIAIITAIFLQVQALWLVLLLSVLLVICHTLIISGITSVSAEVFFPKWRMTGSAIAWSFGAGISGFFPMVSVMIYDNYGQSSLIALVIAVMITGIFGHYLIRISKGYKLLT